MTMSLKLTSLGVSKRSPSTRDVSPNHLESSDDDCIIVQENITRKIDILINHPRKYICLKPLIKVEIANPSPLAIYHTFSGIFMELIQLWGILKNDSIQNLS